jgi:hypothetical protein
VVDSSSPDRLDSTDELVISDADSSSKEVDVPLFLVMEMLSSSKLYLYLIL